MDYDDSNVFARILRNEIPCNSLIETEHTLSFKDIAPQAPVHIIVIPKGKYATYDAFMQTAADMEVIDFGRVTARLIEQEGLEKTGYRVISNAGEHGLQEVPHFHMHILGGRKLGRLLSK